MSLYEQFAEDIPAFVRGKLEPARAGELLAAAEQEMQLKRAIEQERALEQWLEYYEVPEPTPGLSGRFWRRFHESRSRTGLFVKLIGPIAAALLIAAGLFLFVNDEDPPASDRTTADVPEDATEDPPDLLEFFANDEPAAVQPTAEELALLKQLDDPAFAELDKLRHPDDLTLLEDADLLAELAAKEVE